MAYFAQIIANGLHNGAIYALLAYGYVLTYAVTKRANVAHGAVFAFAGQVLVLAANFGYAALWMTVAEAVMFGLAASAALSAIVMMTMAVVVMPRFVAHSPNMMIAASLAVAIVLMEAARIGADTRDYWLPPLLAEPFRFLPAAEAPSVTRLQAINMAVILGLIALSEWLLAKTGAGRALRAVADDSRAAALCGVHSRRIVQAAVFAGGALAWAAGVLAVLYFGNMSFGAGLIYGLKVLFITAAGGFGRPLHAALGAFFYGEAEALWDGYFPIAWRELVFLSFLAFLLCLRTEERAGEAPKT